MQSVSSAVKANAVGTGAANNADTNSIESSYLENNHGVVFNGHFRSRIYRLNNLTYVLKVLISIRPCHTVESGGDIFSLDPSSFHCTANSFINFGTSGGNAVYLEVSRPCGKRT